jgi:hypothetical protein
MKLFAEVYLDEDVSVLIATLLQARGFKAMTARDEGLLGQDDLSLNVLPVQFPNFPTFCNLY